MCWPFDQSMPMNPPVIKIVVKSFTNTMCIVGQSPILLEVHASLLHLRNEVGLKHVVVLFSSDWYIEDEWAANHSSDSYFWEVNFLLKNQI